MSATDPLPKNQRRAMELAGAALTAALGGDWGRAGKLLQRVGDECGPDGVERAMLGWCDTLVAKMGVAPGTPVRIAFQEAGDGKPVTDADEVSREEIVWAGRMVAARAAADHAAWGALIDALPDDPRGVGRHVGAVLEVAALMILREDARREKR